ncbi:(d)CMP kinase [Acetivibrio ethanolgignens]|uniref:Cytidylate kinase n=1 Tax=Acetivibrio ethanolgignens TaxID=290052 RepID=A0A0V8QHQ5_9FIRM|nr:(d)CMP kinase [Acetivibrio ethanolgignens]KSV60084.1 cytidylate kinase [Acetivibrio ethanolgignens]
MSFNVAIDGPAGAGKSTIARQAAKQLNFIYVDTGAMYRAMALFMLRKGISSEDTKGLEAACKEVDITIEYQNGEQQVILNGENVNGLIRTEEVGKMASAVARNGKIREKLVDLQQKLAKKADVIMDGRDIGTCVLPQADVKIYLTASVEERARRRHKELVERGEDCDIEKIKADIIARDEQDMNREISPLKKAEDAVLLDGSDMTIQEVTEEIIGLCRR